MGKKNVWDINFAENKAIADRFKDYFVGRMKNVRADRIALQENWFRHFNMWNITKDGFHTYTGRSNLYIPEVRKNVEAQARQMTEAAFPEEDFFDVSPGLTGTKKGSEAWKAMHQWSIKNSKLRSKYFVAMRQEALLGTSPIYIPWNKIERSELRSERNHKNKKIEAKKRKVEIYNGPDFIVRDLFKWYAFNPNKPDILDDGCFEDLVVGPFDLLRKVKAGLLANIEDIEKGPSNAYLMEELQKDVQRAEAIGLVIQNNMAYSGEAVLKKEDDDEENNGSHLCTVIYVNAVLPEACEDDEDKDQPIPLKIEIYDNQAIGLIQRNPFSHQQPPYVVGKYILPNPDQFYGQGIPWAIQYMQYEINSKAEQSMDSATLALNPIAIVDPGLAGTNNEFSIEPGAIWWGNPQGIKFSAMPDLSEVGYRAISMIRTQMQDYSDRSPALPPQLLGKSRTATQSEMVFDTLGTDNKTFQLQNEQMVLEPMLEQWEALTDQNMDDDQIVMILGRRSNDFKRTLISKADLLGRYKYYWKAASTSKNRQVLARQLLDAIKTLSMLPPQMLQGTQINYPELVKSLWSNGFQLPDGDRIMGTPEEMVTTDPDVENKMAKMGLEIEVLPGDEDQAHLQSHDKALMAAKSEGEKLILMAHMMAHKKQMDRKQQAAQAQKQAQAMQLAMAQAQAGQPGQGGGQRRSHGSGNRTQLSPNANVGNMGSGVRA